MATKEAEPQVEKTEKSVEVEKKVETPKKKEVSEEKPKAEKTIAKSAPKTMEELLSTSGYQVKTPKKGETVTGKVTDKTRKSLLLDIGGKTEGIVLDKEFDAARDYIDQLEVGDPVEAYVISSSSLTAFVALSLPVNSVKNILATWENSKEKKSQSR